ncbi:MAG: bifunctional chorismate mutase/prephenate dehydrogenase [Gemmatimonadota bacterium]|nr:MAG: bifunctional chorismate mutase/prephenate dehydrogenase [Gemmatimonadota bacterium]
MNELESMRDQLRAIDEELFALVARRQRIGLEIGRRKVEAGMPTRDFSQEKTVLQRAANWAREHDLSVDLAERIMLQLIDASLTAQEQSRVVGQGGGEGKRVLVIGGAGKMGGWMARFLSSQDFVVDVADPRGPVAGFGHLSDWHDSDLDHDVIVIAAPIRASRDILQQMVQEPPQGLIFDIGSLKTPLREPLLELAAAGAKVTSIHPMFGPDTDLLSARHVIFVDVGVPHATQAARSLFDSTMALQVQMDLESHDRVIAYVLGLAHALNIAFFTALASSGEEVPELTQFSSTTFDAQLEIARSVSQENPNLYFEIQSLNAYGLDALEALASAVAQIRSVVESEDEASFADLMTTGKRFLERRLAG